jgi:hypothetical protein
MKRFFSSLVFCVACAGAQAAIIESYVSRLDVTDDGAANATVTIRLKDVERGRLVLPVAFADTENFRVIDAAPGSRVEPRKSGERTVFEVEFAEGIANTVMLSFGFTTSNVMAVPKAASGKKPELPDGSRLLSHTFVNTQPLLIESYKLDVVLPEGLRAQLIREQLPKPKRSEVLPRVRLNGYDGRQGAQLQMSGIKQGDRTSMVLEVVDEQRSLGWLAIGLFMAIGYLFGFSHLVRGEKHPSTTA